ncbi:MAG TPA: DALR domain-containing protein, partial [Planctomicrobium sp.]|nr:DALR domain-containing protein [Planctomicrobium sp.]
ILSTSFYDLPAATVRSESVPLDSLPADLKSSVADLRDRFHESMDDDFNTGGAIGMLFELRRTINAFITQNKLEEKASDEQKAQLTTLLALIKELSNTLGVFRIPQQKNSGADDAFVNGLMDLILEIRKEARATKNWAVADKIRDKLTELKVTVEDGKEGVRWSRS